ncbi:MAG: MFS transporter [Verrucomicrobiae bacterium]|nr:MFS transporter [Verrucomicrobiae bacterium]
MRFRRWLELVPSLVVSPPLPHLNALRRQFFFAYGVIGSVMPLMSVFLWKEAGFGLMQIGFATALTNVPMLLSPGIITLLADRNVDSRRILAIAFTVSIAVLSLMYAIPVLWVRLMLFLFHGLAFVAMIPLQDGFYFSFAEARRAAGDPVKPYPSVRVWGTIGFIVPSLIIYFLLQNGASTGRILLCAVAFGVAALVNSFSLPRLPAALDSSVGSGESKRMLPTKEAFRRLISPRARYLCLGLVFGYMAAVAYYTFISIYLREVIGIESHYIGLVINIGVVVEIFFTLMMPKLQRVLRLKGIMVVGLICMAARMILLSLFPTVWTAILVQVVHGMEVLALFIAPVMFLDRLAGDRFRNSIQGVFTMTIGGVSRIFGALMAGYVASKGLGLLLGYGACLATAAMLVILVKFRRIPAPGEAEDE